MNDWLHNLPIVWMALLIFGLTALVTAAIYVVVMGFTASQVWSDNDKANSAVDHEASALRSVVILAAAFPGESETRLRSLIRSYVADAVTQEWPMMAHRAATL